MSKSRSFNIGNTRICISRDATSKSDRSTYTALGQIASILRFRRDTTWFAFWSTPSPLDSRPHSDGIDYPCAQCFRAQAGGQVWSEGDQEEPHRSNDCSYVHQAKYKDSCVDRGSCDVSGSASNVPGFSRYTARRKSALPAFLELLVTFNTLSFRLMNPYMILLLSFRPWFPP